jgi:cell fate regulator YaaT (PSP1 superfamily)
MFLVSARYGAMRQKDSVVTDIEDLRRSEKIVLKTDRGTELGTVNSKPSQLGSDVKWTGTGRILRRATQEDLERYCEQMGCKRKQAENTCREMIEQQKLPMQLVFAEYLLGNEKLYFYFMSETRVDFRSLVRELARRFQTRIELRQIGQREAARLVGDYTCCGHELCCRSFLRKLEPIPMAMARLQKQSLDPSKISGMCGKLKCCLRYEEQVYTELRKKLPERGRRVAVGETFGKVVSCDVYNQRVGVETVEGSFVNVPLAELQDAPPGAYEQALQASSNSGESGRRSRVSGRFPPAGRNRSSSRTTQNAIPKPKSDSTRRQRDRRSSSSRNARPNKGQNGNAGRNPDNGGSRQSS